MNYGEVVRETAAERHERLIEAIITVLVRWHVASDLGREGVRRLAKQILDAMEAGF
jgi:hypothetical protein